MLALLQQWDNAEPRIAAALPMIASGAVQARPAPEMFLAPVPRPPKIVCAGSNYYDHLRHDMGIPDFDKSKFDILFFQKHQAALVGPGATICYPSQSTQLDWEVELVVVFGRGGRRIPIERALDHVAGYSIGIDLSLRDWQLNPRHFKQFDLFTGKSFDDSSPLGPAIVPARFVDPTDLTLKLWVNDELKQNSHTREMIWSI